MKNYTELIMMVGLPGSGKSTLATALAKEKDYRCFSSDEYRKKLLGAESDQTQNAYIFEQSYTNLVASLKQGFDCIFDATNINRKNKKKLISQVRNLSNLRITAYIVNTPIELCYRRDADRERTVGVEVIDKMMRKFECPQFFEGFDKIVIFNTQAFDEKQYKLIADKMINFDQNNRHHLFTLGEHCMKLATNYEKGSNQCLAGLLHDVGKLFTQVIDTEGQAHYYNHDSIGAYYVLSHLELLPDRLALRDILEIVFYINYHMRAHRDFLGTKAQKKYRSLFGDELFDKLMQFAEYDRIASGTYKKEEI